MKVSIDFGYYRDVEFHADTMARVETIISLALKEGYKVTVENEDVENEKPEGE